jgi:hypothetical protein
MVKSAMARISEMAAVARSHWDWGTSNVLTIPARRRACFAASMRFEAVSACAVLLGMETLTDPPAD